MSPAWLFATLQNLLINFGLHGVSEKFGTARENISLPEPPSLLASRVIVNIEKSERDKLDYRGLELENQMKVLSISDSETNKSAASLCVAAGSIQDPTDLEGLAHFCEHMLFLGTDFSSDVNEYKKYLSEHGGSSNAYTSKDHTCYYFDVAAESFSRALLRFSRFFVAPLFTPKMIEREVNAVNSEYEKNIGNDGRRLFRMGYLLADPKHPYSKFPSGNRETLWNLPQEKSIDLREALMEYYKSYYSANLMNLVVLGKENLDQLQLMIETLFNPVINYMYDLPTWTKNPYGPNQLQYRVDIISIKDIRQLQLIFPVQDTSGDYNSFSGGYLSFLVGHEGPGSLLSLLKNKSLCNALSAGVNVIARGSAILKITMDLTVNGLENIDNIICHLFQYINMLKNSKPQAWIWNELAQIGKIHFEFQEKMSPIKMVTGLSPHVHKMKMQHILSAGIYSAEFKPEQISKLLENLIPQNFLAIVAAQKMKNMDAGRKFLEHHYGIDYSKTKFDSQQIHEWQKCTTNNELKLPKPNAYIPKSFEIKARDLKQNGVFPRLLKDGPLSRVWFYQDNEFNIPKGQIVLEIFSLLPSLDAHHSNLNSIFGNAVADSLTEELYAAKYAQLQVIVSSTNNGIDIFWTGFNDNMSALVEMVLKAITNFTLSQKRFYILKDKMIRSLKNWAHTQPYLQAKFYVNYFLVKRKFLPADCLKEAEIENKLTLESVMEYVKKFLGSLKLELLICGNFSEKDSFTLIKTVEDFFNATTPILAADISPNLEVVLPKDINHVLTTVHLSSATSAALVYFQTGSQTPTDNLILQLIASFASEPCFTQLRTKEQLGYIVATQLRRSYGTQGIQIFVQGNYNPKHVDYRIHVFLQQLGETLKELKDDRFHTLVESLRVQLAEKPKTISERANLLWGEIKSRHYNFDRQEIALRILKTITKSDIINFYEKHILMGGTERKRLAVYVTSNSTKISQPLTPEAIAYTISSTFLELKKITSWKAERQFYAPFNSTEALLNLTQGKYA